MGQNWFRAGYVYDVDFNSGKVQKHVEETLEKKLVQKLISSKTLNIFCWWDLYHFLLFSMVENVSKLENKLNHNNIFKSNG